jgi:hypothetical protein
MALGCRELTRLPTVQFFSTAFVSLFKVTAGDPWPADPPLFDAEDGTVNWRVAALHISFEVSVVWVILQVRPAGGRAKRAERVWPAEGLWRAERAERVWPAGVAVSEYVAGGEESMWRAVPRPLLRGAYERRQGWQGRRGARGAGRQN